MITFGIEGGFAAQLRSLQISPDGDLVADISGRRSTGRLSKAQLAAIVAALDASGLFDADHSYPAPSNGADLQRYEITYRGHTVVAHDTTVPRALNGAVRLLDAALRAVR